MTPKRMYKKKTDRQKLRDKADALWRKAVTKQAIERNGIECCERCGRGPGYKLDRHHVFGRKDSVRHEVSNGVLLCAMVCHRGGAHSTNAGDQADYHVWVKGYLGERLFNQLYIQSKTPGKGDYQMEIIKLSAYLEGSDGGL